MNNNIPNDNVNEIATSQSTYSLLVRSEEKERNFFETAIYSLFILCSVFAVWQTAHQTLTIPVRIGGSHVAVETVAPAVAQQS